MTWFALVAALAAVVSRGCTPATAQRSGSCTINMSQAGPEDSPFMMDPQEYEGAQSTMQVSARSPSFLYPTKQASGRKKASVTLTVRSGSSVVLLCTGSGNALTATGGQSGTLACVSGRLQLDDKPVTWSACGCTKRNQPTVQRSKTSCGPSTEKNAKVHAIGWKLANEVFVPQITVCFDHAKETTLYVAHKIDGGSVVSKVSDGQRPNFKNANLFKSQVEKLYTKNSQEKTIEEAFGLTIESSQGSSMFLARGHLSPDADFSLLAEQDATYYYSNVVPQWQAVNNGNWKQLEEATRALASTRGDDVLLVRTGILFSPLMMSDVNNNVRAVYLDPDQERVPVPAVMWKVLHDPKQKRAAAVVMMNSVGRNQDVEQQLESAARTVCDLLPWVDWDTSDISAGLTFCWRVEDLARVLPYELGVSAFELLAD